MRCIHPHYVGKKGVRVMKKVLGQVMPKKEEDDPSAESRTDSNNGQGYVEQSRFGEPWTLEFFCEGDSCLVQRSQSRLVSSRAHNLVSSRLAKNILARRDDIVSKKRDCEHETRDYEHATRHCERETRHCEHETRHCEQDPYL